MGGDVAVSEASADLGDALMPLLPRRCHCLDIGSCQDEEDEEVLSGGVTHFSMSPKKRTEGFPGRVDLLSNTVWY